MSKALDGKDKARLVAIGIAFILVVSLSGVFLSFKRVDATYYGLDKDNWQGVVNTDRVYEPGRHRIGILHSFILFPSIQVSIELTAGEGSGINGRTSDGLLISLDVSFQYQIPKEAVGNVYDEYGQTYENVIIKNSRDVIRDVASEYTAIEFFNNRTLIGDEMETRLRAQLLSLVFVNTPSLQLRAVDLPDAFEDALERAEVARQEIEIALFEQQSALIRAQTEILEAQADANITLIEAQAEADSYLIIINAQAEALNITLTAQSELYYGLSQALNLTSAELLAFLWIQALTQIGEFGNLIIIGPNTPQLIIDTNSTLSM